MNLIKNKNIIILILTNLSILLTLFILMGIVLEIILRTNTKFFFEKNLSFLPHTYVKKEILKRLDVIDINENVSVKKFSDLNLEIFNRSYRDFPSNDDIKYGALDIRYYNQGFCNRNSDSQSNRVLAVGDSFTYCLGLLPEQSWSHLAFENLVDSKFIFNAGYPGVGPDEYNQILKELITDTTELVVFAYYEGNDFRDIISFREIKFSKNLALKELIRDYFGYSYFINFMASMYNKITYIDFSDETIKQNFRYSVNQGGKVISFNTSNTDTDEIESAEKLVNSEENQKLLRESLKDNFLEGKEISLLKKSEILFLYIPSAHSSYRKEDVTFETPSLSILMSNYSKLNREIFSEVCENNDLSCINLTNAFTKYNVGNEFPSHFPTNLHLTEFGHKIVAEEILEWCKKNDFSFTKFD